MKRFSLVFLSKEPDKEEAKMKIFCSQNKIYMKENNWSKVAAGAATSQSDRISDRIPGRIQTRDGNHFFFKNLKQSGQQSGQDLAGFGPLVLHKIFSFFSEFDCRAQPYFQHIHIYTYLTHNYM